MEEIQAIIEILAYILAVVAVLLGIAIALAVTVSILRKVYKLFPKVKLPTLKLPKREKPKQKEMNIMARDKDVATEGVTFNDIFMFMIAVPLVLLWVGSAGSRRSPNQVVLPGTMFVVSAINSTSIL